jgi:3D-(3,5/4)-trihydroxycyclohexane-1,2-dione acylhydrolase (decyclizing)
MQFYPSEKKQRLTLAQAIVKYLQVQYSEYDGEQQRFIAGIWGIFGHGNVSGLSQALVEYGHDLPYHQPRNEQSMVHASTGFARAKRRKATMACTTSIGPGATNMVTGAATATICRIPVLLLPSDHYASRYGGVVLQGIEHLSSDDMSVTDTFRVVSRFYDRITRPEQILASLPEAMRIMTSPADTGAVTLALPQDIQGYAYDYPTTFFEPHVWRIERRLPDPTRVAEAIEMLEAAERPYIIAGGGVHYSEAWDELKEFATAFGIPVGETHAGRGALRDGSNDPLSMSGTGLNGTPAAAAIAGEADLVLCIGTRLHDFITGSSSAFHDPRVRFVSVNVNGRDAYKLGALPITADAKLALQALTDAGRVAGVTPNTEWVSKAQRLASDWETTKREQIYVDRPGEEMTQAQVIGILNDEMQAGDVLVCAAGTVPSDITKLFDPAGGRELHLEFGNSCMGYDIPAAIGVRLAQADGAPGEVYVLLGDGNYQLHPMELVTAMQERTKLTVLLSVNYGYQSIHGHQRHYVGHSLGNEFKVRDEASGEIDKGEYTEVDYVKNAESMGLVGVAVHTASDVREALKAARERDTSTLIACYVDKSYAPPGSGVWWEVIGAEVTGDETTRAIVEEREAGRVNQRYHY